MASPQVENGGITIADELVVALCRSSFTAREFRVIMSIMNMTYRVNKTKAEISVDDLRYATNLKKFMVEDALENLARQNVIFVQGLPNGDQIIGLQKDYEKWGLTDIGETSKSIVLPKSGNVLHTDKPLYSNKPIRSTVPKLGNSVTPPDKLLEYFLKELGLKLGIGRWKAERKSAHALYKLALELCHEPREAVYAIKDFFEEIADTNFRSRVNMPMTYMLSGFAQYQKQIPKKPRSVKTDEEITGYRLRYNVKQGRWVRTNDKLKPVQR